MNFHNYTIKWMLYALNIRRTTWNDNHYSLNNEWWNKYQCILYGIKIRPDIMGSERWESGTWQKPLTWSQRRSADSPAESHLAVRTWVSQSSPPRFPICTWSTRAGTILLPVASSASSFKYQLKCHLRREVFAASQPPSPGPPPTGHHLTPSISPPVESYLFTHSFTA